MSAPDTIPETADVSTRRRWALYAIVAAATIAVALLAIIGVRSLAAPPAIPLGETAARDLIAGSCLAQAGTARAAYTVVSCSDAHAQQLIGHVELDAEAEVYSTFEAVGIFAEAVCDRYLDYGLFLAADASTTEHEVAVLAMPSEVEFASGETAASCSVMAADGSALTSDLYEPLP